MDTFSLSFVVSNLGSKSYQKLLSKFGDSEKAWNGSHSEYEEVGIKGLALSKFENFRKIFAGNKYVKLLEKENVVFVSFLDKAYPKTLKKLPDPPIGIFCKGNLKLLKNKLSIGVVGTRKITEYGKSATRFLVEGLAESNVCIVSGLAIGVDAAAHRAAIESGGATVAVLACGVDCCSPSENYSLYRNIIRSNGLIVSEYPVSLNPNKGTFLARNRIIAALSNGILVTEAAEGSGSLVTADWGFRLSKKVFAVPGSINSPMSKGSISLLKKGAILVTEVEDIFNAYRNGEKNIGKITTTKKSNLSKEEKTVIDLIQSENMTTDDLVKKIKFEVPVVSRILSGLELKGVIKNVNGKWSY